MDPIRINEGAHSIHSEQPFAEVDRLYDELVKIETDCIQAERAQQLTDDQWRARIELHRNLLRKHHELLLTSQHPSADRDLRRMASDCGLPGRMWRHGVHSLLDLMHHHLPPSSEHRLSFLDIASNTIERLHEAAPRFDNTWYECLGDLGRYRLRTNSADSTSDEKWKTISRHWYCRTSFQMPTTGRFYHRLAMLSGSNVVQQMFYLIKSLCVPEPFLQSKELITETFMIGRQLRDMAPCDAAFLQAHAIIFTQTNVEDFKNVVKTFVSGLVSKRPLESGGWVTRQYQMSITLCNCLLAYGDKSSLLQQAINGPQTQDCETETQESESKRIQQLENACTLAQQSDSCVFINAENLDFMAYLHVRLVFMLYVVDHPSAMAYLTHWVPWDLVASSLNDVTVRIHSKGLNPIEVFSNPFRGEDGPLPEDWDMRGLGWAGNYFPPNWFSAHDLDFYSLAGGAEIPTRELARERRVLAVGQRLAQFSAPLDFDPETSLFSSRLREWDNDAKSHSSQMEEPIQSGQGHGGILPNPLTDAAISTPPISPQESFIGKEETALIQILRPETAITSWNVTSHVATDSGTHMSYSTETSSETCAEESFQCMTTPDSASVPSEMSAIDTDPRHSEDPLVETPQSSLDLNIPGISKTPKCNNKTVGILSELEKRDTATPTGGLSAERHLAFQCTQCLLKFSRACDLK
ncbi:hypothetical protein EDB80DRAFT_867582 [Ilyonectria destructans]|nr:hypothetical protein EDB80DRAFT_867582 [Ilyonectria destructans]